MVKLLECFKGMFNRFVILFSKNNTFRYYE